MRTVFLDGNIKQLLWFKDITKLLILARGWHSCLQSFRVKSRRKRAVWSSCVSWKITRCRHDSLPFCNIQLFFSWTHNFLTGAQRTNARSLHTSLLLHVFRSHSTSLTPHLTPPSIVLLVLVSCHPPQEAGHHLSVQLKLASYASQCIL